ncbi:hypothetical protein F4553_007430 [Allocatelliglobosispora scoriae]|uniref:PASTA domain-containing protein n=1 Tax=Allocatelliglobosispora scoriae TaxID=643052 RepID=A0A841C283_9ACTN|nr:PASTA domain-containing protein [Allocatelliglobosispora scoriae]MBB5873996.1 hypothetical protein [Allocatelliglobosispora scoriae]
MRWMAVAVVAASSLATGFAVGVPPQERAAADCLAVSQAFLGKLGIAEAGAVRAETAPTAAGVGRSGTVWFVATRSGASWVTEIDPTGTGTEGLILPLNDRARATSDLGTDAIAGSAAFNGLTESSQGAVDARTCAGTATPTAAPPSAARLTMPDVVGTNAAAAEDQLRRLGFKRIRFGSSESRYGAVIVPANWTVTAQSLQPGHLAAADELIVLTCRK